MGILAWLKSVFMSVYRFFIYVIKYNQYKDREEEQRKIEEIESKLIRHKGPYYSLSFPDGNIENICANCWNEHKTKILINDLGPGYFQCPKCNNRGKYDDYFVYNGDGDSSNKITVI